MIQNADQGVIAVTDMDFKLKTLSVHIQRQKHLV